MDVELNNQIYKEFLKKVLQEKIEKKNIQQGWAYIYLKNYATV